MAFWGGSALPCAVGGAEDGGRGSESAGLRLRPPPALLLLPVAAARPPGASGEGLSEPAMPQGALQGWVGGERLGQGRLLANLWCRKGRGQALEAPQGLLGGPRAQ